MCRWMYAGMVVMYVFVTSVTIIVLLMVAGVRVPELVKWLILVGWAVLCFGGVFVAERLLPFVWPGYRRPILAEEERLGSLMGEVQSRVGSKMRMRFVICGEAEKPTRSLGYRTILIQSGLLALASDGELMGVLAHELGHLRDGDRVMEAACFMAGLLSQVFRWWCRFIRRGFASSVFFGLLLILAMFLFLWVLLPFFLADGVLRLICLGLRQQIDYRQDKFAFRAGCGHGLRAWLVRSGLSVNVGRIRRLEKMV